MSLNQDDIHAEKASVSSKEPVVHASALPAIDISTDQYGDRYVQSKGVTMMESLRAASKTSKYGQRMLWVIGASIWIAAFAYAIQMSTSYNYSVWATSSFQEHSAGLSALTVATSIISAVIQPFLAKFADLWGRTATYFLGTLLYLVGYVTISQSPTLASYIVGNVFATLGAATVSFMNTVIVADLTDLQWRGFFMATLYIPYLITPWFTASIVAKLGTSNNWRWGYGMYAIILPVCTLPIIGALFLLSLRAKKTGIRVAADTTAAEEKGEKNAPKVPALPIWRRVKTTLDELDAFGLILLGFGWTLFLLPFSLEGSAKGHWNNPSMIAMIVVGGLLLIAYVFYERFLAPVPSFPRRILMNKTFMMCIVINFLYEFANLLQVTYFSSYTYIVSNWSLQGWTYFSNTLTLSFCTFSVVAGVLQRVTHRYKLIQVIGLCIEIVGYGLLISPHGQTANSSTALLAASSVITGIGGAFSILASQVAAQASVPHQDMSLVMALLSVWSSVGASIGSAISSVIWSAWMPKNLRKFLPDSVNDTQIAEFYDDITLIRAYDFDDPIRQGAIEAYRHTLWHLFVPGLVLSVISLGAVYFQTDYFLGEQHNAVMNVGPDGKPLENEQIAQMTDTTGMSLPRKGLYYVFGI